MAAEIIIADGGSTDDTLQKARDCGALTIACSLSSRPYQLNCGAAMARADLLYFVHADTLPPPDFANLILEAVKSGSEIGCFRFKFDKNKGMLKFNSFCTRFPLMMVRGGDQSLFINKSLFNKIGGYDESHVVMEDYDIIRRGKAYSKFKLLRGEIQVSSRKYDSNSYMRVNCANLIIFSLYYCGVKPERLLKIYANLIRHPKFQIK